MNNWQPKKLPGVTTPIIYVIVGALNLVSAILCGLSGVGTGFILCGIIAMTYLPLGIYGYKYRIRKRAEVRTENFRTWLMLRDLSVPDNIDWDEINRYPDPGEATQAFLKGAVRCQSNCGENHNWHCYYGVIHVTGIPAQKCWYCKGTGFITPNHYNHHKHKRYGEEHV